MYSHHVGRVKVKSTEERTSTSSLNFDFEFWLSEHEN